MKIQWNGNDGGEIVIAVGKKRPTGIDMAGGPTIQNNDGGGVNKYSKAKGHLICFSCVCVLSFDSLFIRHVQHVRFFTFIFYRHLFGAISFFILLAITSREETFKRITTISRKTALAVGLICTFSVTFSTALRFGIVAISLVVISSAPLFAAVFSWIFIKEAMELRTKIAALVIS